jgi:hypothetical protein
MAANEHNEHKNWFQSRSRRWLKRGIRQHHGRTRKSLKFGAFLNQ